jgi:hypothetical protein
MTTAKTESSHPRFPSGGPPWQRRISFTLPPGRGSSDTAAQLRITSIRQLEKTSYMLTNEQRARLAAANSTARPSNPLQHKSNTALHYNTCTSSDIARTPPRGKTFEVLPVRPSSQSVVDRRATDQPSFDAFRPRRPAAVGEKPMQGKPHSLMQPQPLADVHPFTPMMQQRRQPHETPPSLC